ncbi:MAG: nucleotidyltransferase [Bacteroidales bacterium]|nr:nucleotidyltransferase [Bacteroidales bacterium]
MSTLLILAAGMGSRYGGLKQVDPVGPNGESIIDYSIYDAIRAGFHKVVFVIRESFADAFRESFESKLAGKIKTEYVFQELDSFVPSDINLSDERTKPWGTGHAVLVAKDVINDPFVVINADDFYGPNSYRLLYNYLNAEKQNPERNYSMVGYELDQTLSEHGYVSRGVCESNENGYLKTVVERTHIEKVNNRIISKVAVDKEVELSGKEVVSMNVWGFMPSFFDHLQHYFSTFIRQNAGNPKAEFYIPYVVNELIANGTIDLKVLKSQDKWFGVTYKEDKPDAVENIRKLIDKGVYPEKLWK